MTTLQRLKHEARRAEQRSDWRRAIELYRDALRFDERTGAGPDLSLWNRIGDLHMRLGEAPAAVQCYEQAADRYAEHDLPTSAIAICNKILRIDPRRDVVLRRLGLLHAKTGLIAEGRTACLQFVERALARGATADALEAVQEFVDHTGDERIRLESAELLEAAGRRDEAHAQRRLADHAPEGASEEPARDEPAREEPAREESAREEPAPRASSDEFPPSRPGDPTGEPLDRELRRRLGVDAPRAAAIDGITHSAGVRAEADAIPTEPEEEVRAAIDRFRERLGDLLEGAGPDVRYDLGVAFQSMGLAGEAVHELRHGISAAGRLRAAYARLVALLASGSEGMAPDAPDRADAGGSGSPGEAGTSTSGSGREGHAVQEPQTRSDVTARSERDAPGEEGEPAPDGAGRVDLQGPFFRARLAQYQVRQAQTRHETDHRAHLDLGAAYGEMGLAEEAVRELYVALEGPPSVIGRAITLLAAVARDPRTDPRLSAAVRKRLVDAGHEASRTEGPDRPSEAQGGPGQTPEAEERETVDPVPAGIDEAVRAPSVGLTVPAGPVPPSRDREEAVASADELLASGRTDEAAALLHAALERYGEERRFAEALRVVDRLLDLRPDDVVLHHQRAELAIMLRDRPALVGAYVDLAASLLRQGAPRSAATVFERLLEVDPGHAGALEALARLRSERSAPADARGAPSPPSGDRSDALPPRHAAGGGEFDELLDALRAELPGPDGVDDDPDAHFELGIAFKQMEMWEEALAELERAVKGLADPRPAQEAAGECLVRLGRNGRALGVLEEAESLYPEGEERGRLGVLYWRAEALTGLGRGGEARDLLARIVAVDPDFRDAARRLAALSR
ncbi:MAG: tetratricopeptide repeat protein [Gemmatimonadota bacterium]